MGRVHEDGRRMGAAASFEHPFPNTLVLDPVRLAYRAHAGQIRHLHLHDIPLFDAQRTAVDKELERQKDFFMHVLHQVKKIGEISTTPGMGVRGPFWTDFDRINNKMKRRLKRISPNLLVDSLATATYQSREALSHVSKLSVEDKDKLDELRKAKRKELYKYADTTTSPVLAQQMIPSDLLAKPQFCAEHQIGGCVNSCFRMIFGDIAGWYPGGSMLDRALLDIYKTFRVHTTEYLNVFQTDGFKKETGVGVRILGFEGASFETIRAAAKKIKDKRPSAKIYCLVDLGSESDAGRGVWHANVLLGVNDKHVIVHDPSKKDYGASRRIAKDAFARRWAEASNGGYLVIATHTNPPRW